MKAFMTMNKSFSMAALASLAVLATACGGFEKNPVKDYDFVAGQPTGEPKKVETAYSTALFPKPDLNGQVLNFFEGESRSYTFKTSTTMPGVGYRYVPVELPEGASFNAGENGDFVLSWTPRMGTLMESEFCLRDIPLVLALEITSASGKAAEIVAPLNGSTTAFNIALHCANQGLVIERIAAASKEIEQGSKVEVTVVVASPGNTKSNPPTLKVFDVGGSAEVQTVSLSKHVKFNKAQEENGKFVFKGLVDSSNVSIPSGKTSVVGVLGVKVTGRSSSQTAEITEQITILKKASSEKPATPGAPAKKGSK